MSSVVLPVTLSLLQGPTKALVTSAVGWGAAGAALLAASPNPALCYVPRLAYDADVFEEHSGTKSSGAKPYIKSFSSVELRPIGVDALLKLGTGRNVTLTATRNLSLSLLIRLNKYFIAAYDAEVAAIDADEEPELPPFPWKELREGVDAGCVNALVDLTVQVVRSVLDWVTHLRLPESLSRSLRTILRSATNALADRPFYVRGPLVAGTALYSEATLYMADWIVCCGMESYTIVLNKRPKQNIKHSMQLLGLKCALQAGRCLAALVAVSIGNGIGAMSPGFRFASMLLCSQAAAVLCNLYSNAFIARLLAGSPPPDIPPPSLGPPPPPPSQEPVPQEAPRAAAADALGDIMDMVGAGNAGPAAPEPPAAPLDEVDAPPPPPAPEAQEAPRAVLGGPRLPARPARRRAAPAGPAAPGPETPQAPREPRPVAGNEAEGVMPVAPGGDEGGAPLPPETPPMNVGPSSLSEQ